MAVYALVKPDNSIHIEKDESLIDLTAGVRDGHRWLVIENIEDTTGYTPGNTDYVLERAVPYEVVLADRVTRTIVKRDMTQAERDARLALSYDSMDEAQNKAILVLYKIVWELWTASGGNAVQLRNAINNSPVTADDVRTRVLNG